MKKYPNIQILCELNLSAIKKIDEELGSAETNKHIEKPIFLKKEYPANTKLATIRKDFFGHIMEESKNLYKEQKFLSFREQFLKLSVKSATSAVYLKDCDSSRSSRFTYDKYLSDTTLEKTYDPDEKKNLDAPKEIHFTVQATEDFVELYSRLYKPVRMKFNINLPLLKTGEKTEVKNCIVQGEYPLHFTLAQVRQKIIETLRRDNFEFKYEQYLPLTAEHLILHIENPQNLAKTTTNLRWNETFLHEIKLVDLFALTKTLPKEITFDARLSPTASNLCKKLQTQSSIVDLSKKENQENLQRSTQNEFFRMVPIALQSIDLKFLTPEFTKHIEKTIRQFREKLSKSQPVEEEAEGETAENETKHIKKQLEEPNRKPSNLLDLSRFQFSVQKKEPKQPTKQLTEEERKEAEIKRKEDIEKILMHADFPVGLNEKKFFKKLDEEAKKKEKSKKTGNESKQDSSKKEDDDYSSDEERNVII